MSIMKCANIKCNKEHDGSFGSGKYCGRSCANSRVNSKEIKLSKCTKCKIEITVGKRANINKILCKQCRKVKPCKYCGAKNTNCKHPVLCKKSQILKTLIKHFGFQVSALGTELYYKEFNRIYNLLYEDYIVNELSTTDIQKKYNCQNQRVINTLESLNIPRRSISEANILAEKQGKINRLNSILKAKNNTNKHPHYISGHHTTWNNKKVWLRSSHEFHYAKKLDEKQIDYEVESLRLVYWDSQKFTQRVAIPDFYLPQTNTIVEVKSNYTLDKQNMQDRFKAYELYGYSYKLILNKKEIDL